MAHPRARRHLRPRRGAGPVRRSASAKALVLLALAVAMVLGLAGPASAHAEFTGADPADQAVVDASPEQLTLNFTETISVQADGVRVLDGEGDRVDRGEASASGSQVTVPLEDDLADGSYLVSWRVVSADGHPIHAAYSFSVGAPSELRSDLADEAFAGSADRRDEIIGAVLRVAAYLGALTAAGLVVIGGALRRDDEPSPVDRLAAGAAGLGLVGVVLQLPLQAALATGLGWGAITEAGVFDLAIADGVGWSTLLVAGGLVAIAITTGLPFRGVARVLALVGATAVPVGFAVTGHTRTMSPAAVGYAADVAHAAAAALWLGGLVAVITVVRRRRRAGDAAGAGAAVAHFSGWAAVIVATVVAAGTALGWIEAGGIDGLTSTLYGRLLLAKVAVVALVVAGAAWNRFRLVPLLDATGAEPEGEELAFAAAEDPVADGVDAAPPMAEDPAEARTWSTLLRVVRLEVLGLVVVLALTGVLANVTPGKDATGGGIVSVTVPLGEGEVNVTIDPAAPGRNDVHAYFLDADGRRDDTYDTADFAFSLPSADVGPIDREAQRAGPGHLQIIGIDLTIAGDWSLVVTVKPDRFTEQTATINFQVR